MTWYHGLNHNKVSFDESIKVCIEDAIGDAISPEPLVGQYIGFMNYYYTSNPETQ